MAAHSKMLLYKKVSELTEISVSAFEMLFGIAQYRQLQKGEFILKQGQICKTIVFVDEGYLRTYITKEGVEINTAFTFEGSFTTNLKSLRSASSSETSIKAAEPTKVFEFDKDKLLKLYEVSPEIESFGRRLLEQFLISQEEHANLFKMYLPRERYQYLMAHNPMILQRISLSQLSSYIGMARETLSRIRKIK